MNARIQRVALAGLLSTTLLVGVCACWLSTARTDDSHATSGRQIRVAAADDRLPNTTAADWVTYADHVVEVTVTSSSEIPPTAEEISASEGLILRQLQLTVDRVIWSAPRSERKAPSSFDWIAMGWTFKGDHAHPESRVEMTGEDEPRLEVGQSYLMAIEWEPARCSPGEEPAPASWRGLGGDAIIPVTDNVLGTGELMGRHVDGRARAAAMNPNAVDFSLEDAVTGRSVGALATALSRAHPDDQRAFGPDPAPCP